MQTLKQRMQQYGFISHKDYAYAISCLDNPTIEHLKTLNIEGEAGRRKTAFANALAHALDYQHIQYFEFGLESKTPILIQVDEDHQAIDAEAMQDFEKIIIETCALSEAEKTVLIIDQLHLATFKDHMNLYNFITSKTWNSAENKYFANPKNLLIMMISEAEIYHALQQCSFKIWVDSLHQAGKAPSYYELQLEQTASEWIDAVADIFKFLKVSPTLNAYQKIAFDIEHHVRSAEQLKISLYGWVEGILYPQLFTEEIEPLFFKAQQAIENYIGIDDAIELSGDISNETNEIDFNSPK